MLNLRLLLMTLERSPRIVQPDAVGQYESRLLVVAAALPRTAHLGYASDLLPEPDRPAAVGTVDFYLTQFVLAPRIVIDSRREPLVLGNFSRRDLAFHAPPGLVPLVDLGGGVVLYRAGVR